MSARALLGGIALCALAAGLPLWGHESLRGQVLGRYTASYFTLLLAHALGSVGLLAWTVAARPRNAAGHALGVIERALAPRPRLRAALMAIGWISAAGLVLLLAHSDVGRSWVLHLGALAALLWWTFGLASLAPTPRQAIRGTARAIVALLMGGAIALTGEVLIRRRPDWLPQSLLETLPAGGTDLYPQYLYEEVGGIGFRFRPHIEVVQRVPVGEANLYVQQPGLIRPPPPQEASWPLLEARFQTDENGYRNASPLRDRYRVAVSGDSFTMLAAEPRPWPELLSERLGEPVLNLGFQGYGPQSEAAALARFGLPRHPERLILAYFEGNDLIDAEMYERRRAHGGAWLDYDRAELGLAERSILFQAARHALRSLRGSLGSQGRTALPLEERPYPFEVTLGGRPVSLSLSVGYTSRLALTRGEVEALIGFQSAVEAIARLDEEARRAGARLTVAYLPTKLHTYLPALPQGSLEGRLGGAHRARVAPDGSLLTLPVEGVDVTESELRANVSSLRDALRGALEARGVELLDLTPAFQAEARKGAQLYLTNDTHWTAAGHALAAQSIGAFLAQRP